MSEKQGILKRLEYYADCIDKGIHVTGSQLKRLVMDIREQGGAENPVGWGPSYPQPWMVDAATGNPISPPAEAQSGWYCAHCQRGVDAREVTYSEQHEVCGRYIANDEPPPSAPVGDDRWKALIGQWQRRVGAAGYGGVEDALDAAVAAKSAPVGVERIAAEIRASLGHGATVATRRRWAIELEALAQQPAADDSEQFQRGWQAGMLAGRDSVQPAACPKCDGTGEADSGGIMPWGAPAMIPCDCKQPAAVDEAMVTAAQEQISEGLGAYLRKFTDSEAAMRAREYLHKMPSGEWEGMTRMLAQEALGAALAGRQQGGTPK